MPEKLKKFGDKKKKRKMPLSIQKYECIHDLQKIHAKCVFVTSNTKK